LTEQSGPKCHYIYAKQARRAGKNHEKAITTKHAIILLLEMDLLTMPPITWTVINNGHRRYNSPEGGAVGGGVASEVSRS